MSDSETGTRVPRSAGSIPQTSPVMSDMPTAKAITRQSMPGVERDDRRLSADKESEQEVPAPHRQAKPHRAAGEAEEHALDQELPDEPQAPGAERQAHGNLPLTGGRARHEQARDVAARNHQQHDHHRQQHVQRGRGLVAERGQAAAGGREHDALGAQPIGVVAVDCRCATTTSAWWRTVNAAAIVDGSVPRGTRAKTLSHSTFSCGGQGFRVSPVLFELAFPPYRIVDCIISGTQASTPRIATVVPKNSGGGDADDGERACR